MLIGAGLGAGGAMLSGQDPLKGAAIGGAVGGASAGFGGAGVTSGASAGASAGASNGASHLAQTGAQQATANAGGGLGATIGSGFTDLTGMTGQDVAQMGVQQGIRQVATPPPPQQAIQHAQPNISQPQVDLAQGVPTMNSNPRIKKLQMQGLL